MNDKAVYRTAPATPGLLIIQSQGCKEILVSLLNAKKIGDAVLLHVFNISVFEIIVKSNYQGQKRMQHLHCAILWQNVTWFFQYFWISENVYKNRLKCNLPNIFCISDEMLENVNYSVFDLHRLNRTPCKFFLGFFMKCWFWKLNFIVVHKFI